MKRILVLSILMLVAAPALAAEINAPSVPIPSVPGQNPDSPSGPTTTNAAAPKPAETDPKQMSVSELQAAAEKNNVEAQFLLAEYYGKRNSLDADYGVAAKWYQKAAEQGKKEAQYKLGLLYSESLGVSQNHVAAYFWVSLAAAGGTNKTWIAKRGELEKLISPEQAAAMTKRVETWKPAVPGAEPATP
ncbi:MAG: sel1 repeat family protein [Alphaproteobacteria bacterium]|nr:MAG: sel1 repeat family protein [Alphaproteobacteria bacterium]